MCVSCRHKYRLFLTKSKNKKSHNQAVSATFLFPFSYLFENLKPACKAIFNRFVSYMCHDSSHKQALLIISFGELNFIQKKHLPKMLQKQLR